jgi:hypothetical protein
MHAPASESAADLIRRLKEVPGGSHVMIALDGETERIRAASRTRLTSLILDLTLVHGTGAKL